MENPSKFLEPARIEEIRNILLKEVSTEKQKETELLHEEFLSPLICSQIPSKELVSPCQCESIAKSLESFRDERR